MSGLFFIDGRTGWLAGGARVSKAKIQPQVWKTVDGSNWLRGGGFDETVGTLNDVFFVDQNNGWAVGTSESNGESNGIVFWTTDGGESWLSSIVSSKKCGFLNRVRFTDMGIGWTVGEKEILKSTDNGKNWASSYYEDNVDFFDIAFPSEGRLVAVGSHGMIVYSENSGDSWQTAKLDSSARKGWFSAVLFIDESNGFAVGGFGGRSVMARTRDSGRSWTNVKINMPDSFIQDIAFASNKIFLLGSDSTLATTRSLSESKISNLIIPTRRRIEPALTFTAQFGVGASLK